MECLAETKPPGMPMEGGSHRSCPTAVQKAKAQLENCHGFHGMADRRCLYKYIVSKRRTKENRDMLLNRLGKIVIKDMERLKQFMPFWLCLIGNTYSWGLVARAYQGETLVK